MVDREEGVLWSKVFDDRVYSHDSITRITIPITKGIAGWVVANGKGCRVADAYADPRYGCAATVMPRARMCVCGLWCVAVCDCVWLCDCVAMWLCVAMCGCECVWLRSVAGTGLAVCTWLTQALPQVQPGC